MEENKKELQFNQLVAWNIKKRDKCTLYSIEWFYYHERYLSIHFNKKQLTS